VAIASRSLPVSLLLPLVLLLVLAGCYDRPTTLDDDQRAAVPVVEAVPARFGPTALVERLPGVVKARNQVAIRAELSARAAEVMVESGDAVERGQPLVRLDDATLRDQLRQAEAGHRVAEAQTRQARARIVELEAQVKRSRVLVEESLISELELETQEAQLEAARAGAEEAAAGVEQAAATVEERRTALARTLVRAPVSGRVGRRTVEVGMLVDPGAVLFEIGDLTSLRVEIVLAESTLERVREGQPVLVSAPALGEEALPASLSRISPFLGENNFSTVGEIDVANPEGRLRPGMFVTVDVLHGESDPTTQVPTSALWEDPASGLEGVFVATTPPADTAPDAAPAPAADAEAAAVERTVSFRAVEVLAEGRGSTAVRGVEEGEWVVTVGQHLLRADEPAPARVHRSTWEDVLALEDLKREDVLRAFLAKQRELARTQGAKPPTKEDRLEGLAAPAPTDGTSD
jgi:RND family efflux transporter MFP subunit